MRLLKGGGYIRGSRLDIGDWMFVIRLLEAGKWLSTGKSSTDSRGDGIRWSGRLLSVFCFLLCVPARCVGGRGDDE